MWANLQKRDWMGPSYCVLCKSDSKDNTHLLLGYSYSALVWIKCASFFCLHIDISVCSSVWARLLVHRRKRGFTTIIVTEHMEREE